MPLSSWNLPRQRREEGGSGICSAPKKMNSSPRSAPALFSEADRTVVSLTITCLNAESTLRPSLRQRAWTLIMAADSLMSLLRSLESLSREGSDRFRLVPVDLGAVVNDAVSQMEAA